MGLLSIGGMRLGQSGGIRMCLMRLITRLRLWLIHVHPYDP
jgi:hypothetical protein